MDIWWLLGGMEEDVDFRAAQARIKELVSEVLETLPEDDS